MAEGFDISKYITAADIASAITAGVIAYIKNRPKIDGQQPTAEPQSPSAAKPVSNADPTIRVDRGRIDIQDPKLWQDGGVVNMNGNEIHVFKAPDGSTIRVNPYQLQAAGGDPMKAAMNQFAAKVQNGQVDMDKLFAAGRAVKSTASATPAVFTQNTKDAVRLLAMSQGLDANMQNKVASLAVDNPGLVKVLQSSTGVSQLNKLWRDYWSSLPSEIGPARTAAVKAGNVALQKSILALANQFST